MSRYVECLAGALVLALDQFSKYWAIGISTIYIAPWLNLHLTYNQGASFSILSEGHEWQYWLLVGIAIAACSLVSYWWVKQKQLVTRIALILIAVGAFGNLLDRMRYGAVVDFIDVHFGIYHFPTFNVADSSITIGAALILLFYKSTNNRR